MHALKDIGIELLASFITGLLTMLGINITLTPSNHTPDDTVFACHEHPKGLEGFTVEVDGTTYQCEDIRPR
jgi:hypothetical protein